jgi:hypothetical protein
VVFSYSKKILEGVLHPLKKKRTVTWGMLLQSGHLKYCNAAIERCMGRIYHSFQYIFFLSQEKDANQFPPQRKREGIEIVRT